MYAKCWVTPEPKSLVYSKFKGKKYDKVKKSLLRCDYPCAQEKGDAQNFKF